MKVRHVKNGEYYVLTNFAASGNPIFLNGADVNNFKARLKKHLKDLCEVLGGMYKNDQYKLVVLLDSRESFIKFYRRKKRNEEIPEEDIPESTYILSQEMANIQSGYAKWFNHKYKRFGVVFGRRFIKLWIRGRKELIYWIDRIWDREKYWRFRREWSFRNSYLIRKRWKKKIWDVEIFLDFLPNDLRGRLGNSP